MTQYEPEIPYILLQVDKIKLKNLIQRGTEAHGDAQYLKISTFVIIIIIIIIIIHVIISLRNLKYIQFYSQTFRA